MCLLVRSKPRAFIQDPYREERTGIDVLLGLTRGMDAREGEIPKGLLHVNLWIGETPCHITRKDEVERLRPGLFLFEVVKFEGAVRRDSSAGHR